MPATRSGFAVSALRSILILGLGFCLAPTRSASAQTQALPGQSFAVDIVAGSPAIAQAYTWKLYNDGSSTGVVWTGVTCNASPTPGSQTCIGLMPAYTPGTHTVAITASNAAGESPKSPSLSFTLVAVPNTPSVPRIL